MPDEPTDHEAVLPSHGLLLFTRDEVAELFRVNPKTVGRWVSLGWLQVRRVEGRGMFCQAEVRALLERGVVDRTDL